MAKLKETNVMHQLGWSELTDQEYRDTFNIPENEDINKFMFAHSENENIKHYMTEDGMDERSARAKAKTRTTEAKKQLKNAGAKF